MTILYLHGIGSGKGSRTVTELRKEFTDATILDPELPARPAEAIRFIEDKYMCDPSIDLVIGTSLGGFYAMTLPMVKKILINPAMFADEDIRTAVGMGKHEFLKPRSDGATEYMVDEEFINELKAIRDRIYRNVERHAGAENAGKLDHNVLNDTYAMFGTGDVVVSHYDDFCRLLLPEHAFRFDGEHRLTTENIHEHLIPLVKEVLEESVSYAFIMDFD